VICASCTASIAGEPEDCPECGQASWLAPSEGGSGESYRLEDRIGQGASGFTYRAARRSDGAVVCVKELPYRRLGGSFKALDLFHREAATLRELRHDCIPRYLDEFVSGEGKATSLILVQEFVDGETLAQEMASRRYSEDEVLAILAELLSVLSYLHRLHPPVVHRDLKPSNVMRRRSDGSLVLVDFGSVKSAVADEVTGGSTVAGTFGYMAPEQFYGKASPASDLYGLGVLGAVLLSRRDPADLVDPEHRLDWKRHLRVHAATIALLERWLQPDPERRAQDAELERDRTLAARGALTAPAPEPPRVSPPMTVELAARHVSTHAPTQGDWRLLAVGFAILLPVVPIMFAANRCNDQVTEESSSYESSYWQQEMDRLNRQLPPGIQGLRLDDTLGQVQAQLGDGALRPDARDAVEHPDERATERRFLWDTKLDGGKATCLLSFEEFKGHFDPPLEGVPPDPLVLKVIECQRPAGGDEAFVSLRSLIEGKLGTCPGRDEGGTVRCTWDSMTHSLDLELVISTGRVVLAMYPRDRAHWAGRTR
jgi:serine/threonine protein kinase